MRVKCEVRVKCSTCVCRMKLNEGIVPNVLSQPSTAIQRAELQRMFSAVKHKTLWSFFSMYMYYAPSCPLVHRRQVSQVRSTRGPLIWTSKSCGAVLLPCRFLQDAPGTALQCFVSLYHPLCRALPH